MYKLDSLHHDTIFNIGSL